MFPGKPRSRLFGCFLRTFFLSVCFYILIEFGTCKAICALEKKAHSILYAQRAHANNRHVSYVCCSSSRVLYYLLANKLRYSSCIKFFINMRLNCEVAMDGLNKSGAHK